MWPYSWTHVGTPSHLGHMDRVAATMPSQAHAGAAQEAPNIGQWEGQDVPLVRPSSCTVKGGIPSSRRYLPTYLGTGVSRCLSVARSALIPKAAQALGCSFTPGLRISFGRVTFMARAASVPGLWTLGFLLLCGVCVCIWVPR